MILDIILAAFLALMFFIGQKRGLIKSIQGAVSWVAAIAAAWLLLAPATNFLMTTNAATKLQTAVYDAVYEKADLSSNIEDFELVPQARYLEPFIDTNELKESAAEAAESAAQNAAQTAAAAVTKGIVKAAALCGLMILLKAALWILFCALNIASKLPVLNGTNKLLGGILSLANAMLTVYIICALVALFADDTVTEYINQSVAVKYLFSHNLLFAAVSP